MTLFVTPLRQINANREDFDKKILSFTITVYPVELYDKQLDRNMWVVSME